MSVSENHTSRIQAKDADENLDLKRRIIWNWTEKGIPWRMDENGLEIRDLKTGERIPEVIPRSIRAFKEWNGTNHSAGVLKKYPELEHLRMTRDSVLKRKEGLQAEIQAELDALVAKADEQEINCSKAKEIERLKAELNAERKKCHALEQKYANMRAELHGVRQDLLTEQTKHQGAIKQAQNEQKIKDTAIQELQTTREWLEVKHRQELQEKDDRIKELERINRELMMTLNSHETNLLGAGAGK